jgi:tetratricopeptide (TPR) repeat protein
MWAGKNIACADATRKRMPYNGGLLTNIAYYAGRFDLQDQAADIYRQLIELEPTKPGHYRNLAAGYLRANQRAKAIEVYEQAAERCPFSVTLSNMMGSLAKLLVKEGRVKEALEWGRRSAQSYSYRGLAGLAVALEADGQTEEAMQVWRAVAHRYDSGADDFVGYLIRHKYSHERIDREVAELLAGHRQTQKVVIKGVRDAFVIEPGHYELMEKLHAGSLSDVPADDQCSILLLSALRARDFKRVLAYSQKLAKAGRRTTYQLIWTRFAAVLIEDEAARKRADAEIAAHTGNKDVGTHIRYLLGMIPAERLKESSRTAIQRAYLHWIRGVEAEARNDRAAALKEYRAARDQGFRGQASWTPSAWIERMQPTPATQAAEKQDG